MLLRFSAVRAGVGRPRISRLKPSGARGEAPGNRPERDDGDGDRDGDGDAEMRKTSPFSCLPRRALSALSLALNPALFALVVRPAGLASSCPALPRHSASILITETASASAPKRLTPAPRTHDPRTHTTHNTHTPQRRALTPHSPLSPTPNRRPHPTTTCQETTMVRYDRCALGAPLCWLGHRALGSGLSNTSPDTNAGVSA